VPEFAGDIEATAQLVDIRDGDRAVAMVSRWRDRHAQALLILDQFEELFTLNPSDNQAGFSEFLRRLADDSDVHVLLAMRDDFLFHIHDYPPLAPILDELTLLGPPLREPLLRALVEPARRLGFAFENGGLPGEMIAQVEGERGALPMLAFAVSRLWEGRDRDRKLLTNRAYEEIGGVGGALGRHAETTLTAIGPERLPIVREIFRNLVTFEGTRAVREWDELLSVFPEAQRMDAATVLRRLVDARLLTSFEEEDVEGDGRRRIEVVHESLLSSWPRLVRWQTQDVDAAQLRDQLRQAACTWEERDRTDDLLWTGSAFREFEMWRERYPGGLTEVEEDFAAAMSHSAKRRARRRRIAATSALALAIVLAAVFGTLWRRSVQETRRAEASKLLALAEVQIDEGPTEALAYATTSLELADTEEARMFAVRALWAGPPALALDLRQPGDPEFWVPTFSPDGRWLAVSGLVNEYVLIYGEGGGQPVVLGGHDVPAAGSIRCGWSREGLLVTGHPTEHRVRVWSMPGGHLVRETELGGSGYWQVTGDRLFAGISETDPVSGHRTYRLRSWGLRDGGPEELGEVDWTDLGASSWAFDPGGRGWIYAKDDCVYSRPLPAGGGEHDTMIGRHSSDGIGISHWRRSKGLFSRDSNGEVIQWVTAGGRLVPGRRVRTPETATGSLLPGPNGRWVVES